MHMLFKVCCILMRNAKVNMGQVAQCQKSGQWRIRNFSGLTFLRSKAQAWPSHLGCICFKINLYSYKLYHNKSNETIIAIPEWFGLENTLKPSCSPPLPYAGTRSLQGPFSLDLSTCRDGESTISVPALEFPQSRLLAPSSPAIAVGIVLGWGSSPVAFQAWRQTIPAPKNSPD